MLRNAIETKELERREVQMVAAQSYSVGNGNWQRTPTL